MHKFLSIVFLLILFNSSVSAQRTQPFKVGVILPLTGALAEYGAAEKNGIELAINEHPELFSKVQFIYDDSQYEGKTALSSYQKLKRSDGISLVIIWGYGPNQAVVPVAEKDRFPLIAVTADRSVSLGKQYTLRFYYHMDMMAQILLTYMREHNFKHVGIVKAEIAYVNGLIDKLKENLTNGETLEVVDAYQPGDSDFRTTVSKLRTKKFDAVGVFLVSGQISQFYRQSSQLGFKANTFGTDFFDSMKEIQDAQGAMDGAVFAAPFAEASFVERYVAAYGNDLQVPQAANGYEFAILTAKLFGNKQEQLTGDQILDRFKSASDEQGGATRFKFNESREGSGFDFKVVGRRVEKDRIVNFSE